MNRLLKFRDKGSEEERKADIPFDDVPPPRQEIFSGPDLAGLEKPGWRARRKAALDRSEQNRRIAAGAADNKRAADPEQAQASDDAPPRPATVTAVNGVRANVGRQVAGKYGWLTLSAAGDYSYDPSSAANKLEPGETVTDCFTYTTLNADGNDTQKLIVTLTGACGNPQATIRVDTTAHTGEGDREDSILVLTETVDPASR